MGISRLPRLALLLAIFCWGSAFADELKPIDVVFDLDWTLLYIVDEDALKHKPEDVFEFKDEYYRFTDHTFEVLEKLHSNPQYRVSYFSGGQKDRNEAVVSHIYKKLKQRSSNLASAKAHKILSYEDLTRVEGVSDGAAFADKRKKDISKIPGIDLSRAVLVDDDKRFASKGQADNLLWLGKTYEDTAEFDARRAVQMVPSVGGVDPTAYYPKSYDDWFLERKKLVRIWSMIETARKKSDRLGGSFSEALAGIQKQERSAQAFVLKGMQQLDLNRAAHNCADFISRVSR